MKFIDFLNESSPTSDLKEKAKRVIYMANALEQSKIGTPKSVEMLKKLADSYGRFNDFVKSDPSQAVEMTKIDDKVYKIIRTSIDKYMGGEKDFVERQKLLNGVEADLIKKASVMRIKDYLDEFNEYNSDFTRAAKKFVSLDSPFESPEYQKFVDMVGNLKIVEKEFGHLCHDFDIESED